MIVTRSSALSIQSKMGLPRGNQIVGWIVLSKNALDIPLAPTDIASLSTNNAVLPSPATKQPLLAPLDGRLPHILTNICPSHHILRRTVLLRILRHLNNLGPSRAQHLQLHEARTQFLQTCHTQSHKRHRRSTRLPRLLPIPLTHPL